MKILVVLRLFFFANILVALLSSSAIMAHEPWPFVRYQANEIVDSLPYRAASFCQKVRAVQRGENRQIRILHLGDSHVHADLWSDALRKNLSDSLGIPLVARGWFVPFAAVELAQPNAIEVDYGGRWSYDVIRSERNRHTTGLAGVSLTCRDTAAWISCKVIAPEGDDYQHNMIEIYHDPCDSSCFDVSGSFCILDESYDEAKGCTRFLADRYTDSLLLHVNTTKNKGFSLHGINLCSNMPGLIVHSAGINGASFRYYPNADYLSKHIRAIRPDMIILSLGTNDGLYDRFDADQFRAGVRLMLKRIMISAPGAYIVACIPSDTPSPTPRRQAKKDAVRSIIREEAMAFGLSYWDLFELMGGEGSHRIWGRHGLITPDKIHFCPDGYKIIASLLNQAIFDKLRSVKP